MKGKMDSEKILQSKRWEHFSQIVGKNQISKICLKQILEPSALDIQQNSEKL